MAHGAVEVALALHAAVVLAAVVLELDADPVAGGKQRLADEADDTVAAIAQPDRLSSGEVRHASVRFVVWGQLRAVWTSSTVISLLLYAAAIP